MIVAKTVVAEKIDDQDREKSRREGARERKNERERCNTGKSMRRQHGGKFKYLKKLYI